MRRRILMIVLSTVSPSSTTASRTCSLLAASVLAGTLVLGGCSPAMTRPPVSQEDLMKLRTTADEESVAAGRNVLARSLERTKTHYDRSVAEGKQRPVIDILIISGGGDWGAFGAGFLKGWLKVPAQHPLAKPEFDAVTGVSTGTLIAPFAFLGDPQSIDEIVNLYRNPQEDWVKQRGILYFLPNNISLAEVPGLEREIQKHITADMVRRIAKAGADGRLLLVNTTNLDMGTPRVFDLVAEAQRAADSGELTAFTISCSPQRGFPALFRFGSSMGSSMLTAA
jgi:Patatin-like phospholipase